MDWTAWAPAIISLCASLVMLGGYLAVLREHGRRLDEHDTLHKEIEKHDAAQDVALAGLEQFNKGFSTARAIYERPRQA